MSLAVQLRLKDWAIYNCDRLMRVYYGGTEAEWGNITISNNSYLTDATRYYHSESNLFEGNNAVTEGNYWHYNANGDIVVWTKKTNA